MSKPILIFVILAVFFLIYLIFFHYTLPPTNKYSIKNQTFDLETATTSAQKTKGLSQRSTLCPNCGMIFIFSNDNIQKFWMKDTLIPLDMIWLNSKGEVVSIQTAEPQPNTPIHQLKIYQNQTPAKYVIELNAHTAQKIGLKVGDKIQLGL